jgi:hypothetical protein
LDSHELKSTGELEKKGTTYTGLAASAPALAGKKFKYNDLNMDVQDRGSGRSSGSANARDSDFAILHGLRASAYICSSKFFQFRSLAVPGRRLGSLAGNRDVGRGQNLKFHAFFSPIGRRNELDIEIL